MKSLVKSFLCCLLFLSAFLLVACNNSTKNDIPTSEEIDNSQTTQGNIGDNIVDTEIAEGGVKPSR